MQIVENVFNFCLSMHLASSIFNALHLSILNVPLPPTKKNQVLVIFILFVLYFLTEFYLGDAISKNPGYLKLRKIRAAQNIARTVSVYIFNIL